MAQMPTSWKKSVVIVQIEIMNTNDVILAMFRGCWPVYQYLQMNDYDVYVTMPFISTGGITV